MCPNLSSRQPPELMQSLPDDLCWQTSCVLKGLCQHRLGADNVRRGGAGFLEMLVVPLGSDLLPGWNTWAVQTRSAHWPGHAAGLIPHLELDLYVLAAPALSQHCNAAISCCRWGHSDAVSACVLDRHSQPTKFGSYMIESLLRSYISALNL